MKTVALALAFSPLFALAACGEAEDAPPIEAGDTGEGDDVDEDVVAPVVAQPATLRQVVAFDGARSVVYVFEVQIADLHALTVGVPAEAAPGAGVHLIEIASGAMPSGNAALCDRLASPFAAGEGPCADVELHAVPRIEHSGVLTLAFLSDASVTGEIDAVLSDDTNAHGTFSVAFAE